MPSSTITPTIFFFFFFFLFFSPLTLSLQLQPEQTNPTSNTKYSKYSRPTTPTPTLANTNGFDHSIIHSTLSDINHLVSVISTFTSFIPDTRLSSAISDCLDLLDLSSDELSAAISNNKLFPGGTANRNRDVLSYLSAALGNQDTCAESVSATNGLLGSLIGSGLHAITASVSDTLRQLTSSLSPKERRLTEQRKAAGFPKWVSGDDRRRLLAGPGGMKVDVVVAKDGSGNYTTIGEAVENAPVESEVRFVIYIKRGVYKENVEIKKKHWNVMMVGDGMNVTVISGSRSYIDGWTTYRSATVGISGKGFFARELTIENTAGPSKHQAVALRSDSDLSVYYRCAFRGYQDTLYAHSLRQFYRECVITGTVDFIFGNAAAVFQNSQITARLPLANQKNSITAQGRKDPNQNTGFVVQFCNITADSDLVGAANQTYTYLGRPWKEYSRTMVMQSYLSSVIRPEGWLAWQDDFALSTLYYAEYMNYGPGSGLANRVKWSGYRAISDASQAANFTVAQFIDGNLWLPSTGVKYTAGLML